MSCNSLNYSGACLRNVSNLSNFSSDMINRNSVGLDEYNTDEELAQVPLFVDYPDGLLKFAVACCCIFMIIGIPGNIITIVALSKCRKIRNATAVFIINLSISDLLFSMTVLPLSVSLFANRSWVAGRVMCRLFPAMNYFLASVSLFSIVSITLNRYVMVVYPMHYPRLFQTRNLVIMIIFIWVWSFSMMIPPLTETWGRFSLDMKAQTCTIIPDQNGNSPKIVLISVGFVFPTIFMIACYTRILFIVQRSRTKSHSGPKIIRINGVNNHDITKDSTTGNTQDSIDNEEQKEPNYTMFKRITNTLRFRQRRLSDGPTRKDKRLHTMIAAVMLSFFISHVPIVIVKIASSDFSYCTMLGNLILYLTVCSNPIIYVVMSKDYRQAYKSIFR